MRALAFGYALIDGVGGCGGDVLKVMLIVQ
jgi:hypothetical protein